MNLNSWQKKTLEWIRPVPIEYYLSLHLGNSNLVLSEFEKNQDTFKLIRLSHHPLSNQQDKREDSFKTLLDKEVLANKKIFISVPCESGISRIIQYPIMDTKQLKDSLNFQAEKYLPFSLSEIYFDCLPINQFQKKSNLNQMDVLLVACRRDVVMKAIQSIQKHNGELSGINLDSIASLNSFLRWAPSESKSIYLYLDVGYHVTNISFVQGGKLLFVRTVSYGGMDLIEYLAKNLNIPVAEAESVLVNENDYNVSTKTVFKKAIEKMMNEVKVTINYMESQSDQPLSLENIYLSGGISQNLIFREGVESNLSVQVYDWDPLKGIDIDPLIDGELLKKIRGILPVSSGLALA